MSPGYLVGTSDWTYLEQVINVFGIKTGVSAKISILLMGCTGKAWFDDIVFEDVPQPTCRLQQTQIYDFVKNKKIDVSKLRPWSDLNDPTVTIGWFLLEGTIPTNISTAQFWDRRFVNPNYVVSIVFIDGWDNCTDTKNCLCTSSQTMGIDNNKQLINLPDVPQTTLDYALNTLPIIDTIQYHNVCQNGTCTKITGTGTNECTTIGQSCTTQNNTCKDPLKLGCTYNIPNTYLIGGIGIVSLAILSMSSSKGRK